MSIVNIVTPPRRTRQAGITLVELLISMVIMGVISTMLVTG
jgi:prepilin-type N-terminal cleavage/methylation domain-containing protein